MQRRTLLAGLLAPVIAVLGAWVGFTTTGVVLAPLTGQALVDVLEGNVFMLGHFLIIGVPLSYCMSVITVPVYFWLRSTNRLTLARILTCAGMLGGVCVGAIWAAFFGIKFGLLQVPAGVIAGLSAGYFFWIVGFRSHAARVAL